MRKNVTVDILGYFTQSEWVGNRKCIFMSLLFLVIGIALFSLLVSTIMVNAQPYSNSTSGSSNHTGNSAGTSKATITDNNTQITQMGICVVGVKSPCNGNK
jgi:hypothetical protein